MLFVKNRNPVMKYNKTKNDVSSFLRDKCISTSLKDKLSLNNHVIPFSQLRGVDHLRSSVNEYVYNPLFKTSQYNTLGISPPMTLLIHGASGVGKTYLVHSISQEYKIPIIYGKFDNEVEIRETFRKGSLDEKSIILYDDIDNLTEENNQKEIDQIAKCMKEYRGSSLIIVISEDINGLSRKLRRYDNELFVKMPAITERYEICMGYANNIQHDVKDWMAVAKITPGYTARSLSKLFKMAGGFAISENRNVIQFEDFDKSIRLARDYNDNITFDDIGSLEDVKEELLMSIVYPCKYPDRFKRLGITKPSGVLLYGPPGCGKTLLAKAVSNMSHSNFISVRGPELISKFVGDSEKEIRTLFNRAKHLQPCVIFFDEIDSLCQKRSDSDFGNRIVNQILTLLDGLEDRGEVYVIAATNRLIMLDRALLRPGRFDKIIKISLPEKNGCVDIFNKLTKKTPIEPFDITELQLEGFSGAEIAGIVKDASLICLKENFDNNDIVISSNHFKRAIDKYKLSLMRK